MVEDAMREIAVVDVAVVGVVVDEEAILEATSVRGRHGDECGEVLGKKTVM